jgi:hypothetical protein
MELLLWLESTKFAEWIRESSSILAYPMFLFLHTLGLATVAGLSTFLNLRVLGFVEGLPFSSLSRFVTGIWIAFAVTAASGFVLLIANVSSKLTFVFGVKLVFVFLAVATLQLMSKRVFRNPLADQSPLPRQARVLALASLIFWIGATTAGRLMAYIV